MNNENINIKQKSWLLNVQLQLTWLSYQSEDQMKQKTRLFLKELWLWSYKREICKRNILFIVLYAVVRNSAFNNTEINALVFKHNIATNAKEKGYNNCSLFPLHCSLFLLHLSYFRTSVIKKNRILLRIWKSDIKMTVPNFELPGDTTLSWLNNTVSS